MPRVKQEKKIPTASQREELLLDLLFDDPTNQELLDELNRIDVDYVRLSGEKSMEY